MILKLWDIAVLCMILAILNITDLAGTHSVMCICKCSEIGKEDYHYMRLMGSDWLHKPGNTHVLEFNTLPYSRDWYNEVSYMGKAYDGDRYYTGAIYYFAFDTEHHDCTLSYTGNHYHWDNKHFFEVRTTCGVCGDVVISWASQPCSGPPCSVNILSAPMDDLVE